MRVGVILAHPNPDSFAHELARRAVAGLTTGGHDVELVDLGAIGFRAAMSSEERTAYHGEHPVLDAQVQTQIDLVRSVEALVFVYPTWWSGLPAVLKGWLERVMVPGVGFRFDERTGKIRPNLTNIRHLVGISTYGSPKWYVRAINDNGRRTLMRALRISCGLRVSRRWFGHYAIDSRSEQARREFAARVERELSEL
ncbi:MAG: NAD(P)H-dependent oxidoreductase [Ilumatobacter sp.]|uniref:NAD(P)H-dependent oxidoreductase n=1 Tax=Ilumatobacter sp. TaxID=1967498 RepID=UPI003C755430